MHDRLDQLEKAWRDALADETRARDEAFLTDRVYIAGVECVHLTPERYAALAAVQSPFLTRGQHAAAGDIALALWILSPGYKPGDIAARDAFLTEHVRVDSAQAAADLDRALDDAFADAPGQLTASDTRKHPPVSAHAVLVDWIASEYGWTEQQVLNTPLVRLWQYVRQIRLRADPKTPMFSRADRIKREWFKVQGQLRAEAEKAKHE